MNGDKATRSGNIIPESPLIQVLFLQKQSGWAEDFKARSYLIAKTRHL
ncbi:MAG: hypothetical protein OP8BY_0223 [Candidatus Saccharicenans subterraneus]|uniref:Uncharacterized protein n=1 Tax=Candidatus Saccharicenans subterraneus TaxID=2508984 RepID=A0A3E2BLE2_9BACT|nr:MAG: hypothetical protein OP8BY_0223 [Candidatus Saccharicenans subterraneum]